MRRACIFLTAALLVLAGGAARAQEDKPTDGGGSSAPGAPPSTGTEPAPTGTVDVEKIVLRVNGKTVEAAPAGATVEVTIGLRNFSDKTVDNVKLHIDPSEGGRITDADATYGDIAAGDGADGVFALVVDRDPCPEFYGLGGEISFDGGTAPLKIGIATACPGPRLSIQDVAFTGGDGDGVPEPGETLRAFVILRNDGRDAATNVRATVKVTGKGISSSTDDLAWPDIAPGEAEKSKTALTVTISDDAPRQEGCSGSPRDGGVVVIPPEEGGTPVDDTPISSDGSVGSSGNTSNQPGSSSPGSAGTGSTEPAQVDPAPPSTAEPQPITTTVEPDPGTEPAPPPDRGTIEPAPAPGTPGPEEPAPDRPVQVQLQMDVTATGYTNGLEYSNQTVCAYQEGAPGAPAVDLAKQSSGARDGTTSNTAVPIAMTVLLSAAAVGARWALIR
jgi:hypothetical protein